MAMAVAEFLGGRHQDGSGVFVRIVISNQEGWEYRGVTGPLIMARLPGVVVSDDKMVVFFNRSRGHANVGATSVPLPCGEIRHRYDVTIGRSGRLPPPPPGRAHCGGWKAEGRVPGTGGLRWRAGAADPTGFSVTAGFAWSLVDDIIQGKIRQVNLRLEQIAKEDKHRFDRDGPIHDIKDVNAFARELWYRSSLQLGRCPEPST